MELEAENVKNIRNLAVCKEFLRQAIELNDQLYGIPARQRELAYKFKEAKCR